MDALGGASSPSPCAVHRCCTAARPDPARSRLEPPAWHTRWARLSHGPARARASRSATMVVRLRRGRKGDMQQPRRTALRFDYVPPLDGLRALAVLGVMAYHGGLAFVPGGFFGVDVFFVLSGFLITSLLVSEWGGRGTIALRAFWARRARRLLPALLVLLVAVALDARLVAAPGTYPQLRLDALSALFYVANWHFVLAGQDYFVQTGAVSPLLHTWSLAIEEQFYMVWPLVVAGVLALGRRRRGDGRVGLWVLFGLSVAGAVESAAGVVRVSPGSTSGPTPTLRACSSARRWPSASSCGASGPTGKRATARLWPGRRWAGRCSGPWGSPGRAPPGGRGQPCTTGTPPCSEAASCWWGWRRRR